MISLYGNTIKLKIDSKFYVADGCVMLCIKIRHLMMSYPLMSYLFLLQEYQICFLLDDLVLSDRLSLFIIESSVNVNISFISL